MVTLPTTNLRWQARSAQFLRRQRPRCRRAWSRNTFSSAAVACCSGLQVASGPHIRQHAAALGLADGFRLRCGSCGWEDGNGAASPSAAPAERARSRGGAVGWRSLRRRVPRAARPGHPRMPRRSKASVHDGSRSRSSGSAIVANREQMSRLEWAAGCGCARNPTYAESVGAHPCPPRRPVARRAPRHAVPTCRLVVAVPDSPRMLPARVPEVARGSCRSPETWGAAGRVVSPSVPRSRPRPCQAAARPWRHDLDGGLRARRRQPLLRVRHLALAESLAGTLTLSGRGLRTRLVMATADAARRDEEPWPASAPAAPSGRSGYGDGARQVHSVRPVPVTRSPAPGRCR